VFSEVVRPLATGRRVTLLWITLLREADCGVNWGCGKVSRAGPTLMARSVVGKTHRTSINSAITGTT
jgi:hypothetical protein